jgi:hypothetical protein
MQASCFRSCAGRFYVSRLPFLLLFLVAVQWHDLLVIFPRSLHKVAARAPPALQDLLVMRPFACSPTPFRNASVLCNVEKHIPDHHDQMPSAWRRPPVHRLLRGEPAWESIDEIANISARPFMWATEPLNCCAVSDAYRFIYIKLAKAASSTTLAGFLRPNICPPQDKADEAYSNAVPFSRKCAAHAFQPTDSDCFPCHNIPRWKWLHYFVFTIIRHPLSRALSSYTYCRKKEAGIPFSEWCVNPDRGGGICGPPDVPNIHWSPQSTNFCTVPPHGTGTASCIVDFVGRVEDYIADMDTIVRSINAGREPDRPPLPHFSISPKNLNRQNNEISKEGSWAIPGSSILQLSGNEHCQAALESWYFNDMRLLGYSRMRMS